MNKISVVINTLNEESNIVDCLQSVQDFANEIIICDMHSEDKTVELARKFGAKIIFHEKTGFVEPARKYAISQATNEWVLVLDADERATKDLAEECKRLTQENVYDVALIGVLYNYFGGYVRYGGFFLPGVARFFKKVVYMNSYSESDAKIHQNFKSLLRASNKVYQCPKRSCILHEAYPTIDKYLTKTVFMYSKVEAVELYKNGVRFSLLRLIFQPVYRFCYHYFILLGFRDGIRGIVLNVLHAVYIFNINAYLWSLQEDTRRP